MPDMVEIMLLSYEGIALVSVEREHHTNCVKDPIFYIMRVVYGGGQVRSYRYLGTNAYEFLAKMEYGPA